MEANTSKFPQLIDLADRKFRVGSQSLENVMLTSGLVQREDKPLNDGTSIRFAEELQINQYTMTRGEGDESAQATLQYGFEKDAEIKAESMLVTVTKIMQDTNKWGQINKVLSKLPDLAPNAVDLDLSHRYTFAHDASYVDRSGKTIDNTVGDGLSFINDTHTLTGSATTYSNALNGNAQFSKGALEDAMQQGVEQSFNNIGEKMSSKFDIIFTSDDPTTVHQVQELLNATANVNSDNSGTFNALSGGRIGMRHVMMPRLATDAKGNTDTSKKKFWGIVNSDLISVKYSELTPAQLDLPVQGGNGVDFSTDNLNFKVVIQYATVVCSGQGIIMSKGDAS